MPSNWDKYDPEWNPRVDPAHEWGIFVFHCMVLAGLAMYIWWKM